MYGITTQRLRLTPLTDGDAPFILQLLNDPDFLRFVGDRGVRGLDGAVSYIQNGPQQMYSDHGIGLLRVALIDGTPIGICGLLQRHYLSHPDLGFAILPSFRGQGYATEAARAVMLHGQTVLGYSVILAITNPTNERSALLLKKLGFEFEETVELNGKPTSRFSVTDIKPG